ncbi:MAG: polyketide cyclase, partial [Tateyamaria sp.]
MTDRHTHHKALFAPLRDVLYDYDVDSLRSVLHSLCSDKVVFRLAFPFESVEGVDAFIAAAFEPLAVALPDLERRDHIVMAGSTPEGADWVGCGGYYTGTFAYPWLDIPP